MGRVPRGRGAGFEFGHMTMTPVSSEDLVRVVSRALSERTRRIHLTTGQRRAILSAPRRPGAAQA